MTIYGDQVGWGRERGHWLVTAIPLALIVSLIQVIGTMIASRNQPDHRALDLWAYALLLAGPAALLVRRRWPWLTLGVAVLAVGVYYLAGYPGGPIVLSVPVAFFAGVAAGRRARWHEFQRIRAEQSRRRLTEERLRIAREIHDVLAHNVSLINVQASTALHLMDRKPEQVRDALTVIKQASKDTLVELRATLGALRGVDEPGPGDDAPREPAAGLAKLPATIDRLGAAGLAVTVTTEGTPRPLPAAVDLAVYRIIQEALTNVYRHAQVGRARVRIWYRDEDLEVRIDDDGLGTPPVEGNGIAGMRERAIALGGSLSAGPRPSSGFRVEAQIPLGVS